MFIVSALALAALVIMFLRPESVAQSTSTSGGRYQLVAPRENQVIVFDTVSARTWQYVPAGNPVTGEVSPLSWREISPPFAGK